METTMEVEVDELWTSTVTSTPTMRPHTGLVMSGLVNSDPAARPVTGEEAQ